MINGIIDGISERWQALKDKFSSLTDMLPDWMKPGADKAEISATVTKNDAPAGARVTPAAVSAAVLSLSSQVVAAQPATAQQAANPAPVYFTIHAAPGQDEKGIAREVARQLASEQRKQAAARRSRMSDGE